MAYTKDEQRRRDAAIKRGKRAARNSLKRGGNPYDWETQRLEHDTWAQSYMHECDNAKR